MSWNVWENRKCVWWPPLIFGGKRKWRLSLLSSSSMLKKNFGRLLTRENRITGLRCLRLLTFLRFWLLYDVGKRSLGTKNLLLINFLLTAAMIKHYFEFWSLSQFSSLQNAMIWWKILDATTVINTRLHAAKSNKFMLYKKGLKLREEKEANLG